MYLSSKGQSQRRDRRHRPARTAAWPIPRPSYGLMPAALMIGHVLSASAFTSAPSASGVCRSRGKISYPRSTNRDRTAGSVSASTAAALSLLTIPFGVPLGAKIPNQADQEIFGSPSSAKSEFQVPAPNASRLSPHGLLCTRPAPVAARLAPASPHEAQAPCQQTCP